MCWPDLEMRRAPIGNFVFSDTEGEHCRSKVCDLGHGDRVFDRGGQQDVLRFYVPMNDALAGKWKTHTVCQTLQT